MQLPTTLYILVILIILPTFIQTHSQNQYSGEVFEVYEVDNSLFTGDKFWRGADGAASIDLGNLRIDKLLLSY
jgi:hypothetical protein